MGPYTTGRTLILGHRGASAHAPDNTLESFALALAQGADGVELDVRRSADGVLLLHHDASTPDVGPFVDRPFADIRRLAPNIPTLDEALDVLQEAVINVEIKNSPGEPDFDTDDLIATKVAGWISEHELYDTVIVSSFNPASVLAVRQSDDEVATALLTAAVPPLDALESAAAAGHAAIHPDVASLIAGEPHAVVAAAHASGMHVATWTVNEPAVAAQLANAGVAAIVTDSPDRLRDVAS